MKTFLYLIALFSIFLIYSCIADPNSGLPESDRVSNRVASESGRRIAEKYGMHFCGIGGGADNGIRLLIISFQRFGGPLTEIEARKLIINCIDEFLADINANEEIKPYLKVHPFTHKNVNVMFVNKDLDGEDYNDPFVTVAGGGSALLYTTYESEESKSKKWETYEEAKAILEQERLQSE